MDERFPLGLFVFVLNGKQLVSENLLSCKQRKGAWEWHLMNVIELTHMLND